MLPNFQLLSPSDHITASSLFEGCINTNGPKYLRFDAQVLPVIYDSFKPEILNGFHLHNHGERLCIIATGFMVHTALEVLDEISKDGIKIGLIDMFNLTNFNATKLESIFAPRVYPAEHKMGALHASLHGKKHKNHAKYRALAI